jgi:hypothetical protein
MTTETHHFSDFPSANAYAKERGLDVRDPETISAYGAELAERKQIVASQIGIDPEDFHLRPRVVATTIEQNDN